MRCVLFARDFGCPRNRTHDCHLLFVGWERRSHDVWSWGGSTSDWQSWSSGEVGEGHNTKVNIAASDSSTMEGELENVKSGGRGAGKGGRGGKAGGKAWWKGGKWWLSKCKADLQIKDSAPKTALKTPRMRPQSLTDAITFSAAQIAAKHQ